MAWISSSQPLHDPASISRMASERPSRWRARSPSAWAASPSAAASGPGGAIVALPLRSASSRNDLIARASQIVARIGTIERLVAEREVRNDVAFYGRLQEGPLEPARVPGMNAGKLPVCPDAHAHEDIATERLDQGGALSGRRCRPGGSDLSRRQPAQELGKHPEALADLIHAHQQARIDVACGPHLEVEIQLIVGCIGEGLARIEGATRSAADEAARRVLPSELRRDEAGGNGAVLQRRHRIVDPQDLGARLLEPRQEAADLANALARQVGS